MSSCKLCATSLYAQHDLAQPHSSASPSSSLKCFRTVLATAASCPSEVTEEKIQDTTVSLAAAKKISLDLAFEAALLELFTLKE